MDGGNELTELYDSLSFLYGSLPSGTDQEWKDALKSVLYGGDLLADEATCYGKQQNERNYGKRKDYARQHGNGERVTEFSAITVTEPRPRDEPHLPPGGELPVAPASREVLPVKVSRDGIDRAISLLAEFPAEPAADRSGDGVDLLLDEQRVRQAQQNMGGRQTGQGTTILFVSDTHLGYEARQKTGRGSTVSWIHKISSREMIKNVAQVAIEQDVDAIIHTGDILDHEVSQTVLDATESVLVSLSKIGIPIYAIIGSHDHDSADPQHPDSVNGIAWLKKQVKEGRIIELSEDPVSIGDGSIDLYGISAGNVSIDDVGEYHSRKWNPSSVTFGASSAGPNVLCLHDGLTPYRKHDADVDLDRLLAQSRVSFDCVLIGDEHRPKGQDFANGYSFEARGGVPVFYTGPAMRISEVYRDRNALVTELKIFGDTIRAQRYEI